MRTYAKTGQNLDLKTGPWSISIGLCDRVLTSPLNQLDRIQPLLLKDESDFFCVLSEQVSECISLGICIQRYNYCIFQLSGWVG